MISKSISLSHSTINVFHLLALMAALFFTVVILFEGDFAVLMPFLFYNEHRQMASVASLDDTIWILTIK